MPVRTGVRLAFQFVWGQLREVSAVFGVVLVSDSRDDGPDRRYVVAATDIDPGRPIEPGMLRLQAIELPPASEHAEEQGGSPSPGVLARGKDPDRMATPVSPESFTPFLSIIAAP